MTSEQRYRRFLLLFRICFVLTFGAITLFMYGFVLELRKTVNPGETQPTMFATMMGTDQGVDAVPPGNARSGPASTSSQNDTSEADSNSIDTTAAAAGQASPSNPSYYAPRQGTPRSREQRDERMTVDKFLSGIQRGDRRVLSYAYLALGLMLTIVFGLTTVGLYIGQDNAEAALAKEREDAHRQKREVTA